MTRNDIAAIRAHHPCHSAGTCDLCDLISEVLRLRAVADRVRDLANRAEPDTWVAINRHGDIRIAVPKGPRGQFTLAHPHPPQRPLNIEETS